MRRLRTRVMRYKRLNKVVSRIRKRQLERERWQKAEEKKEKKTMLRVYISL